MLEAGVPIVQVRHGTGRPWDSRNEIQSSSRSLAGQYDWPITALVKDLKLRGVLDDALVFWAKKYRRMPILESTSSATNARKKGRGHNPHRFSTWVARGAVNRGVRRATDELRFRAEQNNIHVGDLHVTHGCLSGLDQEHVTSRYGGSGLQLATVNSQVTRGLTDRVAIMDRDQRIGSLVAPRDLNRKGWLWAAWYQQSIVTTGFTDRSPLDLRCRQPVKFAASQIVKDSQDETTSLLGN